MNTALDEAGATVGPLLIALVVLLKGDFQTGYALLLIPALLALASLVVARFRFPLPSNFEEGRTAPARGFMQTYYIAADACFASGLRASPPESSQLEQCKGNAINNRPLCANGFRSGGRCPAKANATRSNRIVRHFEMRDRSQNRPLLRLNS